MQLQENRVRMTSAMDLLLGLHNELRSFVESMAESYWEALPIERQQPPTFWMHKSVHNARITIFWILDV